MFLAVVGLSVVLARHPDVLTVIRLIGGAYLVYLGGRVVLPTLRRPAEAEQVERPAGEPSASSAFAQGLLTNVTNPKAVLFFAAILPQFIAPGVARIWPQILTLGLVDVVLGFVPWALVIVLGVRLSTVLKRAPVRRWWDRCTGTILGGLGLALILTDE